MTFTANGYEVSLTQSLICVVSSSKDELRFVFSDKAETLMYPFARSGFVVRVMTLVEFFAQGKRDSLAAMGATIEEDGFTFII